MGSCVPGPAQARLRQFLEDGENASKALGQLAEFGAGESDVLPALGGSSRVASASWRACWALSASRSSTGAS